MITHAMGEVEVTDYDQGRFVVPPAEGVLVPLTIALRGLIARPIGASASSQSPLIVLAHGRHSAAVANFRGLGYLARHLASNGYTCASIDLNDTVAPGGSTLSIRPQRITGGAIYHRALAILNTIVAFRDDPLLAPTIDFKRVGLIGHSRGGEAVCRAAQMDWEAGRSHGIRAVFSIAPVDFTGTSVRQPLFLLYGDLDGDVSDGQSLRIGDRALGARYGLYLRGATHNLFSSNWQNERGDLPAGRTLSRAQHENLARAYTRAFFDRHLRAQPELDKVLWQVVAAGAAAEVTAERLYPPTTSTEIDGFEGGFNPSSNGLGLTNATLGQAAIREVDVAGFVIDPNALGDDLSELLRLHGNLSVAASQEERDILSSHLEAQSQRVVTRLRYGYEANPSDRRSSLLDAILALAPNFEPTGPGWRLLAAQFVEEAPDLQPLQTLYDAFIAVARNDHTFNHVGKALSLEWSHSNAIYLTQLGGFDASAYEWLHLRTGQDYRDSDDAKRNAPNTAQDLTLELHDESDAVRALQIGLIDGPLLSPSPDQRTFKTTLRTVLVPLSRFAEGDGGVDLTSLRELRLLCDRSTSGSIVVDSLGFSRLGGPDIA